LDGFPQTSSLKPWKVLLLSNDIGGSKYIIGSTIYLVAYSNNNIQ
jgi:hypothetical protein